MKKIGLIIKEVSESRIKNSIKGSGAVFIIKYSGLSSLALSALRQSLKSSNSNLFVVKNSVALRAFRDLGLEAMIKCIDGPCGLVFAKDEPVGASRVLCNFSKVHEQLKLEGGFLPDRILEKKDIEAMSKLPSREVLRAQVVMTLNSPIAGFARVLNQTLKKFVYCLDQIRQKKTS